MFLLTGHFAGEFDELAPVHQRLQVHQNHIGALVLREIPEQIQFGDIGLVAKADEF